MRTDYPHEADQPVICMDASVELLLSVGGGGLVKYISGSSIVMTKFLSHNTFLFYFRQIFVYGNSVSHDSTLMGAEQLFLGYQIITICFYKHIFICSQ